MTTEQNPKKAMWLSLIPGLGQIYNKQKNQRLYFSCRNCSLSRLFPRNWSWRISEIGYTWNRPWTR